MAEHTEAGVEWTAADVDRMISMRRVETDEKRELKRTLLAGDLTGAGVEWTAADVDRMVSLGWIKAGTIAHIPAAEQRELKRQLLAGDYTARWPVWVSEAAAVTEACERARAAGEFPTGEPVWVSDAAAVTAACERARAARDRALSAAAEAIAICKRIATAKATMSTDADSAATDATCDRARDHELDSTAELKNQLDAAAEAELLSVTSTRTTPDDGQLTRSADLAAAIQTPRRILAAARALLEQLTSANADVPCRTGERRYTVQVAELARATAHLEPAVSWSADLVNLAIGEINRQFPDMVLVQGSTSRVCKEPARGAGQVLITAVPAHLLAPRSYAWHAAYQACSHEC